MNLKSILVVLFALVVITGCGQKGDLYLTENAPPPSLEEDKSDKKYKEE
ncbi:MAG: hypothetical protein EP297_09820 [Gammaproteobacteria bacterium]|nr:MAG: hypothetical protein EP297_09820 [Gammaproteobacteria bacterium]